MWTYFDTSALVKRYIEEAGRREVLQLLRQYDCVTSAVLAVELRSGLRRRVGEGTLDAARVPAILKRVAKDRAYWTLVEVGTDVLSAAETLVATHPLRTLDAIHVASVLVARGAVAGLALLSLDERIRKIARRVGIALLPEHVPSSP